MGNATLPRPSGMRAETWSTSHLFLKYIFVSLRLCYARYFIAPWRTRRVGSQWTSERFAPQGINRFNDTSVPILSVGRSLSRVLKRFRDLRCDPTWGSQSWLQPPFRRPL